MELPLWLRIAESLAAVATPILIAVGGFFAWYKFIRQGEHDPRLQPSVSAQLVTRNEKIYLIAELSAQNTGQVDVALDPGPSGLSILTRKAGEGWVDPEIVYSVFLGQHMVQPGETLEDRIWIELGYGGEVALSLELTVAEKETLAWRTHEIVPLAGNPGGQSRSGG